MTLTRGFWLGVHPVTQAQWQVVRGDNPSHFRGDTLPVENVSWDDCQEFLKQLGERLGEAFRLPTEAEWESACRAGTATPFFPGDTLSTDQANYNGNHTYGEGTRGVYREKTTPVGSFAANAWGLHELHGNVWEWCRDWYGPYQEGHCEDQMGPDSGQYRVLRGGSWLNRPVYCRSADRSHLGPADRDGNIGFRVALSPRTL